MKPAPRTILHPDLYPGTTRKDAKAEALRKRANEAYANGDFEEALTKYSESALHDPTEATTWSNRSATLLQLDRAEDAFDDAERCLWLDPAFGKGYLRRGAAEWRLGRRADARASYEAGLRADPGNVRLMEELARCEARADTEPAQAARAAVSRTMLVSPSLDVEGLFELLQAPERLTAAAVSERAPSLDALLEYLCRTLECDLVVLRDCAPLREADVAVSSDNMSPDRDDKGHASYAAGGTLEDGISPYIYAALDWSPARSATCLLYTSPSPRDRG